MTIDSNLFGFYVCLGVFVFALIMVAVVYETYKEKEKKKERVERDFKNFF